MSTSSKSIAKLYLKRLILLALLALLLLPAGQARFNWIDNGKLSGYYPPPTPLPELSLDSLKANSYQTTLEHHLEDELGFRAWLIRFRNQLTFSLFNESNDPNLFVGPNSSLYDARTLYAAIGRDAAVDDATVQRHIRRLRVVQDTLARRGKLLVFVTAASKASFAPEETPAYFQRQPHRATNYERYTAAMRAAGINLADMSQAMRHWKATAKYPLFPLHGGHWSALGATKVGDSLLRYVEHKYGHPMRDYRILPGQITDVPREDDVDTENALNLYWPLQSQTMHNPQVEFEPLKPGQRRPTVLLIGDSFMFTVLYQFFAQAFDDQNSRFWFYNVLNRTIIWPNNIPEGTNIDALDRKKEYLARDIILVMFTEYNLDKRLDYGFSDDAYTLFVPHTAADSVKIKALEQTIRAKHTSDDYWWKRSTETGLSPDQLVHNQAVAQYDSLR